MKKTIVYNSDFNDFEKISNVSELVKIAETENFELFASADDINKHADKIGKASFEIGISFSDFDWSFQFDYLTA